MAGPFSSSPQARGIFGGGPAAAPAKQGLFGLGGGGMDPQMLMMLAGTMISGNSDPADMASLMMQQRALGEDRRREDEDLMRQQEKAAHLQQVLGGIDWEAVKSDPAQLAQVIQLMEDPKDAFASGLGYYDTTYDNGLAKADSDSTNYWRGQTAQSGMGVNSAQVEKIRNDMRLDNEKFTFDTAPPAMPEMPSAMPATPAEPMPLQQGNGSMLMDPNQPPPANEPPPFNAAEATSWTPYYSHYLGKPKEGHAYNAAGKQVSLMDAGATPEFGDENALRGQYLPPARNYAASVDSYNTMFDLADDSTGASDIALVRSFFTTLEPQGIVREGEFRQAAETAGLPDQFVQAFAKLDTGEILSPEMRTALVGAAKRYAESAHTNLTGLNSEYATLAAEYGMKPERISIINRELKQPKKAAEPPKITTNEEYNALPSGVEYVAPDGQVRRKN